MLSDTEYLTRAVALAWQAAGRTAPNPLVGCVLVKEGTVVGEGWHQGPGTPHAEAMALAAAGEHARGAAAYVTLEPCNHFGNTPPCARSLVRAGIERCVYGAADPNPLAAGGAVSLRAAGITADRAEFPPAEDLIRPWVHTLQADRPYVYAKLAMSLDGRTATASGESQWITGSAARRQGHDLRQRTDAIIVGIRTVLADDPALDPRPDGIDPAPGLKIVLDTDLRTPPEARLLRSPGEAVIVAGPEAAADRAAALERAGARIWSFDDQDPAMRLRRLLRRLKDHPCQSVMIEGGSRVLGSAFDAGLVDEVWAFIAPLVIGGGQGAIGGRGPARLVDAPRLGLLSVEPCGDDLFIRGRVMREEH